MSSNHFWVLCIFSFDLPFDSWVLSECANVFCVIYNSLAVSVAHLQKLIYFFSLSFFFFSQFPFDATQVRVLLYREDDSHGRRLLFDSHALQKVTLKEFSAATGSGKFLKNEKYTSLQNGKIQAKAHSNNNSSNLIEVCPEYGYKVSKCSHIAISLSNIIISYKNLLLSGNRFGFYKKKSIVCKSFKMSFILFLIL